jgi:hypothetical protein
MTIAKFKVFSARREYNSRNSATVLINRQNNLFMVRPRHSKRMYEMTLDDVAAFVCDRIMKAEYRQKLADKKLRRKLRGGR